MARFLVVMGTGANQIIKGMLRMKDGCDTSFARQEAHAAVENV
jgi:hypothetical protein